MRIFSHKTYQDAYFRLTPFKSPSNHLVYELLHWKPQPQTREKQNLSKNHKIYNYGFQQLLLILVQKRQQQTDEAAAAVSSWKFDEDRLHLLSAPKSIKMSKSKHFYKY